MNVTPRQIPVNVTADDLSPLCGGQSQLQATGSYGFEDRFENGTDGSVWSNIINGLADDRCGVLPGSENALYFPFESNATREAETNDFDATDCQQINWCIYFSDGSGPCDAMDATDDIELQYSTNGGTTWNQLNLMQGSDFSGAGWTCLNEQLPTAAQTAATRFRFEQLGGTSTTGDE